MSPDQRRRLESEIGDDLRVIGRLSRKVSDYILSRLQQFGYVSALDPEAMDLLEVRRVLGDTAVILDAFMNRAASR